MFALPLTAAVIMPLILTAFGTVSLVVGVQRTAWRICCWAAACLAVGTWISALTENQIIAYLATFGALLVAYLMNGIKTMFTSGNLLAFIVLLWSYCSSRLMLVGVALQKPDRLAWAVFCVRALWCWWCCSGCARRGCCRPLTRCCRRWRCLTPFQRRGGRHVQHLGHRVLSVGHRGCSCS